MGSQEFCLKWNNHQGNLIDVFDDLLFSEELVDVTLACQGLCLKVHKVVLSACSTFFRQLFRSNPCQHPIIFMNDVNFADLKAIVQFMYKGEVNVSQEQLPHLLKVAETFKVKGLAEVTCDKNLDCESGNILKRKRHQSDSLKQASQDKVNDSTKQQTDEKRIQKVENTSINQVSCAMEKSHPNEFQASFDESNVPFTESSGVNSVSTCPLTSSPSIASQNIKNSPHSSPEPANDVDLNSCIDPNQYLLQQFSCPDSGLPNKTDESSNMNNNTHSQSMFPGTQPPFDSTSNSHLPPGAVFPPNLPLPDHSSFPSSSLSQSSSSHPMYSNNTVGNMNAVGLSLSEISALQDSTTPEKNWRSRGRPASWTQETLHCAMTAVLKEGWSVTAAARKFGIPQPTLHSYISKFYRRRHSTSAHCTAATQALSSIPSVSNPSSLDAPITLGDQSSPQTLVIDLPQSPPAATKENPPLTLLFKEGEKCEEISSQNLKLV